MPDGVRARRRLADLVVQYPKKGRRFFTTMLKREGFAVGEIWVRVELARIRSKDHELPQQEIQKEYADNKATITAKSLNIRSLEDLLTASEVDLGVWEVDKHIVNSWEVTTKEGACYTNYQVKAWLKRRVVAPIDAALRETVEVLRELHPVYPKPPQPRGNHLLEISIVDHHFGKLAWREETGTDYDLKIAERLFAQAVAALLDRGRRFGVRKILLPIGNDFLHINGPENATAAGTPQDVDSRYPKIFTSAKVAFIQAVNTCLKVAPVEVIWVGSNHDMTASYALAQVVAAYFHKCANVTVNAGADARKFVRHGACLLGFTHGNEEKQADLPLIMATTRPQDWAETTHREWHIGHLHKKKETRYVAGDTWNGVAVRILPSLSGTDAWHYRKGYCNGQRAAEAYLWHDTHGYAGHLSVNATELSAM